MTDERRDDEVLGRALSRAIETQTPKETLFERSRIADRPPRRGFGFWQFAGVAAALVLALAFGSWFTRPTETGPVAASSSPTSASTSVGPFASPSASPTALAAQQTVFVPRDGLPPMLKLANGGNPVATIEERIKMRIEALNNAVSGLSGTALLADPKQFFVRSVTVQNGTATIDYSSRWPAMGSGGDSALAKQIVYTATEEAAVLRVLVTDNGKPMDTGHIFWDKPLAREDVAGYAVAVQGALSDPGAGDVPASDLRLSTSYSVDTFAPGLARFVIQVDRANGALPRGYIPKFSAQLYGASVDDQSGLRGKAVLVVTVDGVDTKVGVETVDRSPLRSVNTVGPTSPAGPTAPTTYQLKLDAGYPWRVFTLSNPTRLVIDVGGPTASVSDRIAVYSPTPMAPPSGITVGAPSSASPSTSLGRQFTLSGAARVFEANVVWRVKDSTRRVVAEGHTTASLGTSPVWGTFSTQITVPASVTGNITLEVYEASPKDGSEQGLVAIPLTVR